VPEEANLHTVLKYLAFVNPLRGKPPGSPDDPTSFELVFSADPERMAALGWGAAEDRGARLLGPGDLTM